MCGYIKPIRVVKHKPIPKFKEEEIKQELVTKEIGKQIYNARTSLNLKREDLARILNKSSGFIRDWETGIANYDKKTANLFEKHLKIKFNK